MELNFGNGNFYSFSHMYSDNQCQNVELEYVSYEGTYVVVDNDNLQLSNGVTQLDMELNDLLMFIDLGSFTTYYLIEDGFLFMNDTSSSDVSINRNVAFTKEN